MSNSLPSVRRNLLANYVGQGWVAVVNLAFIPVYLRQLGVEAYGLVGIFGIVIACASLLDAAITPALNREMARFRSGGHDAQSIADLLRSVEVLSACVIAVQVLVAWLVADWLAAGWLTQSSLPPSTVGHALFLMSIVAGSRVAEGIYRGALLGLSRPVSLNAAMVVLSTLRSGGAALALILVSPTIQVFFVWQAISSGISLATLAWMTHRALPRPPRPARFSKAALGEIRQFSAGLLGTALLGLVMTQGDKVLLAKLLPLQLFAYYTIATTISNSLYQLIAPVAQSYYPRFTELATRGAMDSLATCYHQAAQILSVVIAPASLLLIVFGDRVLFLWTRNPDVAAQSGAVLSLLALGTLVHGILHIPYMLQLARGWSSLAVRVNLATCLFMFPALFWLVPRFGGIAAAGVWLATNLLSMLVTIRLMHRQILPAEKADWYARDVGAVVAAAAMVTLGARAMWPASLPRPAEISLLALTLLAGSVASALAATAVRNRLFALSRRAHPNQASR
jgi:O-antigen/teichoic acid export membrane protein